MINAIAGAVGSLLCGLTTRSYGKELSRRSIDFYCTVRRRVLNFALRGATLVSKFLLIFVLAKFLEPRDVGFYGLLAATVAYLLMAVGFDFYAYSTRELIAADRLRWSAMLRDQGAFFALVYLVVLPLSFLVFWFGFLPWEFVGWFMALLVLEHLCQEFNRLLVAMSEPLWASVVLFVRSGAWALVVAGVLWFHPELRSLQTVLLAWLLGALVACGLAAIRLRHLDRRALANPIDWSWIRRGIRVAVPLLVATLALRGLYTFDRYWIEALGGLDVLAAYVLFVGIANAILSFLDAGVFAFQYPALISAASKGDVGGFAAAMRRLALQTFVIAAVLAVAAVLLAYPLVVWLDKPVYILHFDLLYWTVLATVIFSLSMIPHYGLYARRRDLPIIGSHMGGLLVFFIAVNTLQAIVGDNAVPAGMCVAFSFILVVKAVAYRRSSSDFSSPTQV